ncbi:hypothetical protein OROHE_018934 [Orobanche hederae]
MKNDDELERLLGEIHATSPLNRHPTLDDVHHYHHRHNINLVDHHGYGHASYEPRRVNGHGHVVYDDDELLKHKYACASSSSPVSGFSLRSDGSSSSLYSSGGGGLSLSDLGSPSSPQIEILNGHLIPGNGFRLDFKKDHDDTNFLDDFNLSRNFSKMYISDEQDYGPEYLNGVQSCNRSSNGANLLNLEKYGLFDNYKNDFSNGRGVNNLSVPRGPVDFGSPLVEKQHDYNRYSNLGSPFSINRPETLLSRPYFSNFTLSPRFYRTNVSNNFPTGFVMPEVLSPPLFNRPSFGDSFPYSSQNRMNLIETKRDPFYVPNTLQSACSTPHHNEGNLLNGRNRVPQGSIEAFTREGGSLIAKEEGIHYVMTNRGHARSRGHSNTKNVNHESGAGKPQEKMSFAFSLPEKCSSLAEVRGYIYLIAKDQLGCRFLQRIFDEGTCQDVQMVFEEVIDHVVELMTNPFGNYLMQKLLEVCNEEQRMHIVLRVTEEPGELVRISLNTHGTRVVQKLIETLKTRQQISLVILALEPGFLALIKDLNGNHVVQRCLQCFTTEDSKFIFIAAAKYCVDIATHQHGCCVLQRCIGHATGELRENLIEEISENGLLLAQDAYGNYVIQFILELKIPSATSKLSSHFEGHYVHLSRQKFSSHVVEKCLLVGNDGIRSKIIQELLSAAYFEQLLQDPHANYVIQTALRVTEGRLHTCLVQAVESYKAISRNSPYSKRIFSHKLLKR